MYLYTNFIYIIFFSIMISYLYFLIFLFFRFLQFQFRLLFFLLKLLVRCSHHFHSPGIEGWSPSSNHRMSHCHPKQYMPSWIFFLYSFSSHSSLFKCSSSGILFMLVLCFFEISDFQFCLFFLISDFQLCALIILECVFGGGGWRWGWLVL